MKYFRHYLYGKVFRARKDHGSLRWLTNFKDPEGQIARWLEILSSYSMKIEHRPGRLHRNADGLSRRPCKQCGQKIPDEVELKECVNQVSLRDLTESGEIKDAQSKDKDVSLVKSCVTSGVKPAYKEVLSNSSFVKSLWSQWPRLNIKDDLLVRYYEVLGTDLVRWQVVVPLNYRRTVLKYTHDIKASGHLGVTKTQSKIQQ